MTAPIHNLSPSNFQSSILSDLQKDSAIFQDLGNNFRYIAPDLLIATFYETLGMKFGTDSLNVSLMLVEEQDLRSLLGIDCRAVECDVKSAQ